MMTGAEIPFRRSRFAWRDGVAGTGSLIFDRQREDHRREAAQEEQPMQVWSKGRFVRS